MAIALVQDKYQRITVFETLTLDAPPTPGNVLVAWETLRETNILNAPNGFEPHPDAYVNANSDSGQLWVRVVETGDSATLTGWDPGADVYIAEWSGVAEYEWAGSHDNETSDPIATGPDSAAGEGIVFAGILWRTPTDTTAEAIAPTGDSVELEDAKGEGHYHPLLWAAYVPAPSAGSYSVTGDPNGALTHTWAGEVVILYEGGDLPEPPPVDPGYEPPDPGRAILEMYMHDEDATRWGTATWSADLTPTGTEGIWSGAGWQDVTPQGVSVHVIWGTTRAERGILAVQEAQSWLVETYDPDRILDPGNVDGPFYPQVVSGVPIRVTNEASGRVIRTGIVDRVRYRFKAPEYRGTITASSTIAALHRAHVPADTILGDTLRERIQDAVVAAGVAIGGIPVVGFDDSYPAIDLSPRIEGDASAWEHIRRAGEEVLWVVYEDEHGTLQSRPWGNPADRGRTITYANLEDLTSESSEDGVYSVVRVNNADDTAIIERVAAPLPRYGRIVYERNETTLDPEAWADALLADRAWPGVQWTPGTIWCFDAADVDYFGSLEIMERVEVLVPGAVDVFGKVLGMELWVSQVTDEKARWLFLPKLATDGSSSLGITTLVSDGGGDFMVDDATGTDYLEAD